MDKKAWKKRIVQACEAAGTYKPFFDSVIDTLAGVMELRDSAKEKFDALGGEAVTEHTNKGGATNVVKNPALVVLMDCNTQALAYWKELGLTSKAYKQMQGSLNVAEEEASLEKVLANIGI